MLNGVGGKKFRKANIRKGKGYFFLLFPAK
jgi:hypothetical protein